MMINTALLREQLTRFWPVALLTTLGYLLFVFLPIYIHAGGHNAQESARVMIEVLSMRNSFMMIATVLVPFSTVMILFSYLFDERATIGFYGFSDNKNQLFWTNVSAGLILTLAPLLLISILMLIGVRYPGGLELSPALYPRGLPVGNLVNPFPVVMFFFLRLIASYLFYFSIFLLAAVLSGSGLAAVLLSIFLPLLPMFLYRLGLLIASVYVVGLDTANTLSVEIVLGYTSPVMWYWNFGRVNQGLYFLVYIMIAVMLIMVSNIFFRKRKLELIGNPVVFESCRVVLVFLMSMAGMIAMGRFLITLSTSRWVMYFGFVLGFGITFCIAQMIFARNFDIRNKLRSIVSSAIVAGLLYAIIMLIMVFGTRCDTHYIPAQHTIAGVYLSNESPWVEGEVFTTNPDTIARTVTLHGQIVDDLIVYLYGVLWQSMSGGNRQFVEQGGQHLYLAYQLHNGDVVFRRYALSGHFIDMWGVRNLW